MTDPSQWTEADLRRLITDQVKESVTLDYKQSRSLGRGDHEKNELSKDVSAMANSAGGVLIYGVDMDGHLPMGIDEGLDPGIISKESLEDTIGSRIQRRIDGLLINQVELSSAPGRVAYVVVVPQSLRVPHMAFDHRFYRRANFKSEPMEEFEVREVATRREVPDLTLSPYLIPDPVVLPASTEEFGNFELYFGIGNEAEMPAEHALIRLWLDTRLRIVTGSSWLQHAEQTRRDFGGHGIDTRRLRLVWKPPEQIPIWKGLEQQLPIITLQVLRRSFVGYVEWQVDSPRMPPATGQLKIASNGSHITLGPIDKTLWTE
jgi:hypothetical protein